MPTSWIYDGADPGTLSATIDSVPGATYQLYVNDPGGPHSDTQVASGSTLILTISGITGMDSSEYFFAYVQTTSFGTDAAIAAGIFQFATAASSPASSSVTVDYDGADTVTLHVPTIVGHDIETGILASFSGGTSNTGTGSTMDVTVDLSGGGYSLGDMVGVVAEDDSDAGAAGYSDLFAGLVEYGVPSSPTLTPGGDDCASAVDLGAGTSGTISDDNTGWAGTWPTGADPLWNYFAGLRGGGAPRWWKWTNGGADPVDFQLTKVAGGIDVNAAVMVGTCGSLAITNQSGVNTNFVQSDFFLADGETIDVIVPAGATVYVEVDSYYDNPSPSEPPDASGHEGAFTLTWSVVSVAFYDGMPTSELLASGVATGYDVGTRPEVLDGIKVGSAYFFLWKQTTSGANELWGGTINADGTGLATGKIADYSDTATYFYDGSTRSSSILSDNDNGPMLATDGTRVWAGFFTDDGLTGRNQSDTSWIEQTKCIGTLAEIYLTRTPPANLVYRGHFFEWTGSAWAPWQQLNQDIYDHATDATGDSPGALGYRGPESSNGAGGVRYLAWKMCASANDPDHLWVVASYAGLRTSLKDWDNNNPACGGGGGPCFGFAITITGDEDIHCPESHFDFEYTFEFVDRWRIGDGDAAPATTTLTSDGTAPANGDTVTIGTRTYTFRTTLSSGPTVSYEVKIGGSAATALANLKKAINGTGTQGSEYSKATFKNQFVSGDELTSTTLVLTTLTANAAANSFASTETSVHLSFTGATFSGGHDPGVPPATHIAGQTIGVRHVSTYDPTINPVFDTANARFGIVNDEWMTSSDRFPSVAVKSLWVFNDRSGGEPILCVNPRDTFKANTSTVKDTVEFWDTDGTVLQTNASVDYIPGGADIGTPTSTALYVSDIFANSDSGDDERFVSLRGFPTSPQVGVARIISTVDDDPIPIDAGNAALSDTEEFSRSWFCDTPRNYWSAGGSGTRLIANYDMLCYHNWVGAWTEEVEGLTSAGFPRRFGIQRGYWDSSEPPSVVLFNNANEIRKYTVARDYYICSIGLVTIGQQIRGWMIARF